MTVLQFHVKIVILLGKNTMSLSDTEKERKKVLLKTQDKNYQTNDFNF